MDAMNAQNAQQTVVVGLGKTGLSVVRFLRARGDDITVVDSRPNPPALGQLKAAFPEVDVHLGAFDEDVLSAADRVVLSPGVSRKAGVIAHLIERGMPVVGDIELFARAALAPVVAITGSNGKSTVTTLVGEMAKAAGINARVGGNLGTPALELLDEKAELYVLELSSFQLESTDSLKALAAVVLNITEDHLDRYDSLEEYANSKRVIYRDAFTRICNREDRLALDACGDNCDISFGLDAPENGHYGLRQIDGADWLARGESCFLPVSALKVSGRHNWVNVLAAFALGEAAGLQQDDMLRAAQQFAGLPHRCQFIAEVDEVVYINDSKGTNVGATVAALEGLSRTRSGKIILIAGGEAKDADLSPLKPAVTRYCRSLVTIGRDGFLIAKVVGDNVPEQAAGDLYEAVRLAASVALPGDTVLLSPACASFDMFANYEQRGQTFIDAVGGLTT